MVMGYLKQMKEILFEMKREELMLNIQEFEFCILVDRRGELYVSLGVNRWLINVEGRVSDIKELGFFIGLNLKGNFLLFL